MNIPRPAAERGIALPVMLIILLVMLVSSIYLFKATNSTTLTTSNLAYDAALSSEADLGLHTAFQWLSATATANKPLLDADDPQHGYVARFDTSQTPASDAFWTGMQTITGADGDRIDYVVHRLCARGGAWDDPHNFCVQTAANTSVLGNTVALGDSLASDSPAFAGTPQIHYVVTARIHGPRGGNVINQLVVLIGA